MRGLERVGRDRAGAAFASGRLLSPAARAGAGAKVA